MWWRAGLSLLFLAVLPGSAAQAGEAPVFVLVPGAWTDGSYWDPVAGHLAAAGAEVHAVTLPRGRAAITLDDQADAILAVLRSGDRAILVAHSAGTRPATAAWDRARDRVAAVAFVEGVPPVPGAAETAIPPDEQSLAWMRRNAPEVIESGLLPVPERISGRLKAGALPHPIGPLYDAVRLRNGALPRDLPQLYVIARDSPAPVFTPIADILRQVPDWRVETIPGGHDVADDAPGALARLLLDMLPR